MPADDRKAVRDELEDLQLQEARAQARGREQKRVNKESRKEAIEISLKRDRNNQERIQAACYHKKGGKGTSQLYAGNDANYAVVTHTLSHGETIVICQRCGHIERPPSPLAKNASREAKQKYREDLTEYRRWLNFPTDNEPSGTTLFAFTPVDEEAA